MIALALVFIVAGGGLAYLLLRMFDLAESQRMFCMITTLIALSLGIFFREYAINAVIAILVAGMAGLLAIDRRSGSGQPRSSEVSLPQDESSEQRAA